jgi:integrase
MNLIIRNPIAPVKSPKPRKKEMKTLDDYQVRELLRVAEGTDLETLLFVEIATGLRMGEIIGLKWSDLDMANGTLRVCRQVQREKKNGLVFSEPKSEKSRRVVMLGVTAIKKLRAHADRQYLQKMAAGVRWVENDLIFPNTIGKPMEHRRLLEEFKKLLVKAGLPIIRFHDLRQTAATLMLLAGVHPKIVQETLGHSDINLTLNTYSHALPTLQREAAAKMDELMTLTEVEPFKDSIKSKKE